MVTVATVTPVTATTVAQPPVETQPGAAVAGPVAWGVPSKEMMRIQSDSRFRYRQWSCRRRSSGNRSGSCCCCRTGRHRRSTTKARAGVVEIEHAAAQASPGGAHSPADDLCRHAQRLLHVGGLLLMMLARGCVHFEGAGEEDELSAIDTMRSTSVNPERAQRRQFVRFRSFGIAIERRAHGHAVL